MKVEVLKSDETMPLKCCISSKKFEDLSLHSNSGWFCVAGDNNRQAWGITREVNDDVVQMESGGSCLCVYYLLGSEV